MTYTYTCEECGATRDYNIPLADYQRKPKCECGSRAMRRIFTNPTVIVYNEDRFTRQLSRKGKEIWARGKAKAGINAI